MLVTTRLLVTTGAEAYDRWLNERFVAQCHRLGASVEFECVPGGHEAELVARSLGRHLDFHARAFGLRELVPAKGA